jgi:hypothetical protein
MHLLRGYHRLRQDYGRLQAQASSVLLYSHIQVSLLVLQPHRRVRGTGHSRRRGELPLEGMRRHRLDRLR